MENAYARANNFYSRSGRSSGPQYVEATILENGRPVYQQTNWQTKRAQSPAEEKISPLKAIGKLAGGAVLAIVGVPLLVLPGPGLLCIVGGVALAGSGVKDILGLAGF